MVDVLFNSNVEGLGSGGADYLIDVEVHAVAGDLELVDQADVDVAVNALQQLAGPGGADVSEGDHFAEEGLTARVHAGMRLLARLESL